VSVDCFVGSWRRISLSVAAALAVAAGAAQGQSSITVVPLQGLRFGVLSAGLPTPVSPDAAGSRAALEIVGSGAVTVSFRLPAALTTRTGAQLPLRFASTDGRVLIGGARPLLFDPWTPVAFSMPSGGGVASVFLGASAEPRANQPPGDYSGIIEVEVVVANATT
jgi:hypothetical protein